MGSKKTSAPAKAQESKKRKATPGQPSKDNKPGQPANSRAFKRVKIHDARHIRTQQPDAALDDGGNLDLQKFIGAREFEIKAMEDSMSKCKAANATRVFQQVPRALRRRTASHNSKRVPKRLRARAKREMLEDNTPTVEARKRRPRTTTARLRSETAKQLRLLAAKKKEKKSKQQEQEETAAGQDTTTATVAKLHTRAPRPKIRRNLLNEPPKPESKFRRRQINKTWLPTHLWHAKRATMTEPTRPFWRFAIPLTPTEKCYRTTHRASGHRGAVAWDMSYMSTIGLYGSDKGVESVLRGLGLTQEGLWGARGRKWRAGLSKWTGIVSKPRRGTRRDIGPVTIVWNPEAPGPDEDAMDEGQPKKPQLRQIFLRTHPSCFLELFQELLKFAKMHKPQLHVEDLRFEIGSIEITGPGSTEALLGVLQPYVGPSHSKEEQGNMFRSLAGVTNPAMLPKDALLGFSVLDPRLSYPPKRVPLPGGSGNSALVDLLASWPAGKGLKPYELFARDARFSASRLPSQKSLNKRKGANMPGEPVKATAADPPIPIILYSSRSEAGSQAQGTWTLLAPWKCITPIWYSLMHYPLSTGGNPRFGGLQEQQQIAFEHGQPWFPADFPATEAGMKWELEHRAQRKRDWERRPKGKRTEWGALDLGAGRKGEVGDGLACDFEHLFALINKASHTQPAAEAGEAMSIDPPQLSESSAPPKASAPAPAASVLATTEHMSKASFASLLASPDAAPLPPHSLITVHLTLVARGVATTCARIYRLPSQTTTSTVPSSSLEVPSTVPPSSVPGKLPHDLKVQWLRKLSTASASKDDVRGKQPPRMPPNADSDTRKRLIARSILADDLPSDWPRPPSVAFDANHPLCPGEEDLIGFVTTGAFCLTEGKATAVGSISAVRALETYRRTGTKEARLCVVRNAGESVGWLARWEAI